MKKRIHQPHNIIIILAIIAVLNAIYLISVAYGGSSFCDINSSLSCGSVFGFSWSWIGGIPFPVIALIVYPVIAYVGWRGRRYDIDSLKRRKWVRILSGLGILFNSYFLIHEIITGVYCPLCLVCWLIIVSIFIMSWRQMHVLKEVQHKIHKKHKK